MRLLVARCEVSYTGRLTAFLPEAVRLLMLKSDGSVLVHADSGGYKPLNWMTPPTVIEEADGLSSSASAPARPRTGSRSGSPRCSATSTCRWTRSPGSRRTASSAPAGGARRAAGLARGGAPARPARVDDRDRPGRPDVPRLRRRLGRGRDQARRHDRGGRAADALPRLHPRRPGEGALPRHPRGADASSRRR